MRGIDEVAARAIHLQDTVKSLSHILEKFLPYFTPGSTFLDSQSKMEAEIKASSRVQPQWLPGGDMFWYKRMLPENSHEFILVDAVKGTRQAGLSQESLADEVEQLTGERPNIEASAQTSLEWDAPSDNTGLKGTFQEKEYASPFAATEVSIQFINKCSGPLRVFWIDHASEPVARGTIEVGATMQFITWQGHLWKITGKNESTGGNLLYAAPKEDIKDALIIDDALLHDGSARKRSDGTQLPHIFVRDDALWMKNENGIEILLADDKNTREPFDKDRIYVSPDRRYVAAWQYTPEQEHMLYLVESSTADQVRPKVRSIQCLRPGDQVRVDRPRLFDLANGTEVPTEDTLFRNPYALTNVGWDPNSKEYRFIFNERGHQTLRFLAMGIDGFVRNLAEEKSQTFIDYSGKQYHFLLANSQEMIWASERDGWNHLYLYDLRRGGLTNQITTGEWLVRSVDRVDEDQRVLWFTGYGMVKEQDPYYAQLARINFDGSNLTILTDGNGTHDWKWSPGHKYLLDTWSRVDCPPQTVLRNATDGARIMTVQECQIERLKDAQWSAPEIFTTTGRDGVTSIHGVIFRPENFDENKKYPIFEEVYAGPQGYFTPKYFTRYSWHRGWANRGYIVVQIDGMGTNWRSKAFLDVCYKNLHDAGFPDRIKWIKEAAATRPWMDLNRVGIRGTSGGGQTAGAALIFHNDFYKVAAADSGCHDNRMDKVWWNEQWMGWPVGKAYEDASNVVNAHKLQGKLMLVVGNMDDIVDPSSTYQFVNALNNANKFYELLLIPDGKHACGHGEYGQMRMADFFRRNLQEA